MIIIFNKKKYLIFNIKFKNKKSFIKINISKNEE